MVSKVLGYINTGVLSGRYDRLWLVPDCGLKTRRWEEVVPSLRNMVAAANILRDRVKGTLPAPAPAPAQPVILPATGSAVAAPVAVCPCCL